jgi:EAL and modified HD-GYP domain-containing signal transduction protein
VSPEFLSLDLARNLLPERVVLQLSAESFSDPTALDLLHELRAAGYQLALDQFRYQPGLDPVLNLVEFVKVDLAAEGARELAHQSFQPDRFEVTLVAQNVEAPEDFRLAKAAGAELFQGFFFCRPHLVGARAILPSRLALMQLASALQDPAIQLSEIANLRPWVTLTILADLGDKPQELFVTALIRAQFCQEAGRNEDGSPPERFTLGLFSVLDAPTDISMHTALQALPLTPSMRYALIHHSGPGRLSTRSWRSSRATSIAQRRSSMTLRCTIWPRLPGATTRASS